jgi:hypothetical protein
MSDEGHPLEEQQAVVRSWLAEVWAPATHNLVSSDDVMEFGASYEEWLPFVQALKFFAGQPPEPERHYGTFRVIDGGGMLGE